MLKIRLVVAGAALAVATGVAGAQTATNEVPGKPLQLLQILAKPGVGAAKAHSRRFARRPHANRLATAAEEPSRRAVAPARTPAPAHVRTATAPHIRIAATRHRRIALVPHRHARLAIAGLPAQITATEPAVEPVFEPAEVTAFAPEPLPVQEPEPAAKPSPPAPVETAVESTPRSLRVDGQDVRVVAADEANEIDLAADARDSVETKVAAAWPAIPDITATASSPGAETAVVARTPETNLVGGVSWIIQVLAALGGAVAAGAVAWILIGSAPRPSYE